MTNTQPTGLQPNCQWPQINTKWARENGKSEENQPSRTKQKVPGTWRICSECRNWAEQTVVNSAYKGYTCFGCLGIE